MHCISKRYAQIGLAAAAGLVIGAQPAYAAGEVQLENIVVTSDKPATAPYEAPTQGSLDAGEPQSVINQHFIENNAAAGSNYTDIINIAPSVADTTPNGRGNAESLNMSIRGFQDGQFNVTFDGIPWNDSNDFTHHSTSYFTANTIGRINVDRGPGTASQVGNATFGGTVALESKDPMQAHNVTPSLTLGSYRSIDSSLQIDTGNLADANGGRATLALTSIKTDGAMTNNSLDRKNVFFKYVQPVSADTTVTAVAMYNTVLQNVAQFGTPQSQLAQFGPSYSLSTNTASESYYGYNFDDIHTDFEYVDVKTVLGAWRVDNKAYTYGYYHKINETNDPSMAGGSSGAVGSTNFPATDVSGQKGYNNYRSVGDISRFDTDLGPGVARVGLWVDYQWNDRYLYDVDWSRGGIIDTSQDTNGVQRLMHDTLTTLSPFFEYEYRPTDQLTITPGLRYTSFKRSLDAVVNQKSELPLNYSHTWTGAQPSVYANYKIAANWSTYAQFARGFLAPNLNLLYRTSAAAAGAITPEQTNNLQAGTTWKSQALTVSADLYHIKFNNFLSTSKGAGSYVIVNAGGGAVFKGEELEATYALGAGVSIYANGSHNNATYNDGTPVLNSPNGTAALGLIYDQGGLYASLIGKHVGSTVQAGVDSNITIAGFTTSDLAVVYTVRNPGFGARNVRLKFGVANLSDNRAPYYIYGSTIPTLASPGPNGNGYDDYMTLPGRAYSFGLSADF